MNKSDSYASMASSIASALNKLTPAEHFAREVVTLFGIAPEEFLSWSDVITHDVIAFLVESGDAGFLKFVPDAANPNGDDYFECISKYIELRSRIERFGQVCAATFILQSDHRVYIADIKLPKLVSWVSGQVTREPLMSELTKIHPLVFQDICLETVRHLEYMTYSHPKDE
ncbi:MAG: hypothetical protein IPG93_26080 [Burkholderiales bacterium]|nr:hypothetical protein [Burkholderiales bacterium]